MKGTCKLTEKGLILGLKLEISAIKKLIIVLIITNFIELLILVQMIIHTK